MIYEHFSDRARTIFQLAKQESRRFEHYYVGTEHLLLGFLKEGSGVGITALKNLGIELDAVRLRIEKLLEAAEGLHYVNESYPQTPRFKRAIEYAIEESRDLGHDYVGTEHILLGLMHQDATDTAQLLRELGLQLATVRNEIRAVLRRASEDESSPFSLDTRVIWITNHLKSTDRIPNACPKCDDARVARVLWHCVHLHGQDEQDVEAGRAILGSITEAEGPQWVCLRCAPRWADVHALAMQDHRWQVAKELAIYHQDFEEAAKCNLAQLGVRRQLAEITAELVNSR